MYRERHLAAGLCALLMACGAPQSKQPKPAQKVAVKPAPKPAPKPKTEADKLTERCEANLKTARGGRDRIVNGKSADTLTVLNTFNAVEMALYNAEAESSLWRSVHPDAAVRKAAEACERKVSTLTTELTLDRALYDVFASLKGDALDVNAKRLLKKTLEDFKRAGVDQDERVRKRIKAVKDELVKVQQAFAKGIITDKRTVSLDPKELEGLPADWIAAHKPGKDGKVSVSTDYPDYIPFMTYAVSDSAKKALYTTYRQRGTPHNAKTLARMIALRYELAKLLGFPNWAQFITSDKMMGSADNAQKFIEKIRVISDKRMKRERKQLLKELKRVDRKARVVQDWQKTYLLGKVKKRKFNFDAQKLRPYLHYNKVKKGLMDLTSELFGITYKPNKQAKLWHQDVTVYDVFEGEQLLGTIYLDMHPRDHKYKHAAQFTLRPGAKGVQKPAGVLVCNFPNPRTGNGLMEHKQVQTFFHEFGHLMHHVLGGQQQWVRFSGVATEWDFVEAPSQIFEEWATDYDTLARFATDAKGAVIPKALVQQMRKAKEFGKALMVRHQMFYASVSLGLYNADPKTIAPDAFVAKMMKRYSPYPFLEGTHMQNSFGHLSGYSAIYYTYMWSLVISKDMFSRFAKEGILNKSTSMAYRNKILGPGGTKPAKELIADFLGRPYDFKSFERWLNRD